MRSNNICVYHYSYSLNHSPLDIKPWYWLPKLHQTRIYDVISKGSSECLWIQRIHTHTLNDTLHFFHLSLPKRNERKKTYGYELSKGYKGYVRFYTSIWFIVISIMNFNDIEMNVSIERRNTINMKFNQIWIPKQLRT